MKRSISKYFPLNSSCNDENEDEDTDSSLSSESE
eukprot:CAMPEP_0202976098 /NCGR_PEP_ID=MMETSP1396-20130829/74391_1 /ASSEMBLY_ACC=CAM_ASM_000872 /TAXON_ID= /ORGANISM="Pseudokeronopsis sp., Strain Brazil" /LENGTH=33 /DNA_ID= /DNA_START= /DNA_END= /DNA_ORIENTATION=